MNHLLTTRKGVGGAEMEEEPLSENLKVLIERKKIEEKKRAIKHWGILSQSIRFTMKAMEEADVKDIHISHGMLHLRKLNHNKKLKCVAFMINKKEYLTTDGQTVRLFLEDGRKKAEYIPEEPMDNIVYCKQTNQYVGWVKDEEELFLMNPEFEIISQSKVPCKINLAKYNNSTNEFITIGPGFMVCWAFRYGARHLIPRKMTRIEYKENNQFKHLVLEETASRHQKCFLSLGNGVVVFNVFEGKQLAKRKDLHEREITALTYFNPLKYLVTASKDGTIKVWDKEWFLKTVFVGHTKYVNLLTVYPEGPQIISASLDCSIRVWNLDSCDEADQIVLDAPVENLGAELNYHLLFTYSGKTVDLWRLNHLYHIHTAVGHRVVSIKQTTHPHHPIRALVVGRDCSVRVICPPNGEVITTFLLDQSDGIVDSAYAIGEEMLFTLKKNGDIVKCKTNTNPATVVAEWECENPREACNYLLIYEYVPEFETNAWAAFKRGLATKTIGQENADVSNEKSILLGGRKDGHICVFDWDTGEVTFKIDAHGIKGVLSMIGNSKQDQLISAGLDNIIKVWRLFPFAEEALAPLMSFYCAHTPVYMTMLKTNLCVAFQDHATATYSIVIYNLKDRTLEKEVSSTESLLINSNRYDHKPDDDHTDTITGLTSCVRMKLYASSSLDGTIRIWNETNTLSRILKLKTMPYSIGFCSQKGDLLIGVENHLYKIPYYMYLPRAYKVKMVSMKFVDPKPEHAIPYDEEVLSQLSKFDYTRLKQSHSSFTYDHFEDILTPEEEEEVTREQKIKQAAYSELKMREQELMNLRNGKISPRIRPLKTPETKQHAFDKYMRIYYDKPRLSVPKDELFPKDKVLDYLRGTPEKVETPFTPEREPTGFFPPKSQSAKSRTSSKSKDSAKRSDGRETPTPLEPQYAPINTDGFVPNSVLTKILFPPPPEKKKKEVTWKPPTFTDDQLIKPESPEQEEEVEGEEVEEEPVMIMDWGDEEESVHESPVPDEKTPSPPPIKSKEVTFDRKPTVHVIDQEKSISPTPPQSRQASSLMSKFKEMQAKPPSPIPKLVDEEDDDTSTLTATPRSLSDFEQLKPEKSLLAEKQPSSADSEPKAKRTPPPPASAPRSPVKKEPKPEKPVEEPPKPKPTAPPSEPPPPKPRPAPPPKEPTPPRPTTPLPQFITQFKGADWFEKYFPNANENNVPKPWTVDNFAIVVSRLLRIAEYIYKISVADALIMMQTQEDLSEPTAHQITKTLSAVLNDHKDPPTCMDEKQKSFIVSALRLLNNFNIRDKEFITELMVQFLDGDKEVRTTVVEIFQSNSLHDPHKYLQKELDSWDIWNVEEDDRKADLRKMCHQWLDRWMTSYKMHLNDTIDKMKKGQNVHGKMSRGQMQKRTSSTSSKSILKRQGGASETILEDQEEFVPRPPGGPKSITVTFDKPPDAALVESATYIDAINYFCDMMVSKEVDLSRRGDKKTAGPKGGQENVVQAKNTVLVLPKLPHKPALVRLGETHTSTCRAHRETNLHIDYRMPAITYRGRQPEPGQLSGFAPSINLPMKSVYLNPFPSVIDQYDTRIQEPVLITLKSAQKYFIPNQSFIAQEPPLGVAPAH